MCAVLKTLHSMKSILNGEECRSVGEAEVRWSDDLVIVLAVKPPGMLQETMEVFEEYKREFWYGITTERIKSKLCSRSHFVHTVGSVPPTFSSDCVPPHTVDQILAYCSYNNVLCGQSVYQCCYPTQCCQSYTRRSW